MKNRIAIQVSYLLLLLPCIAATAAAQIPDDVEQKSNVFGGLEYRLTNNGVFGFDAVNGAYGLFSPRGSAMNYLFGGGLWFGARKWSRPAPDSALRLQKLSFLTFNPASGDSWATPGEWKWSGSIPPATPSLFHSQRYNPNTGTSIESGDKPNWPLWLLPGEKASPLSVGRFVPIDADRIPGGGPFARPAFMPGVDEQFFARYHDGDISRYELGAAQAERLGYPIGLQIDQGVYDWDEFNITGKSNAVVVQYRIVNVSPDTLFDCVVAQVADPDIGDAPNDYQGFVGGAPPQYRSSFSWTESEALPFGTLAMIMIEAPVTDDNGFVDNARRADFRLDGEVGTFRNWSADLVLRTPEERYDFMSSGSLDAYAGPHDWRALMASKRFNMAPGDTAHVAFAYVVIDAADPSTQIPEAFDELRSTLLDEYYLSGFRSLHSSSAPDPERSPELTVVPNPASDRVRLTGTLPSDSPCDATVSVADHIGRTIYIARLQHRTVSLTADLDLGSIPSGSYIVTVQCGSVRFTKRLNIVR